KDGNKNLLQSNAWDQRQQIKPRRDIKNHRVRDKIYCEDSIENGGHLFLLPRRSTIFNSQSSTNRAQLLFTVAGHSLLCSRSWNTICFDHSGQKFGITKGPSVRHGNEINATSSASCRQAAFTTWVAPPRRAIPSA